MPTTALAYGSEYGADSRPQTQGFGGYNAGMMMYNVPQPSTQTPVYDAQQFGQRQQAAMQMMAPDVTSTYFSPEAGSAVAAAAAASMQHPSQGSSASAGVYQQSQPMNYASNMPAANAMQQASGAADSAMGEGQDYAASGLQEKWLNYQRQLGSVFQDISSISLERAAETLLNVSSWLLTQVAELGEKTKPKPAGGGGLKFVLTCETGLSQDDASLHAERINLWNDFNHAWLALCFRQKEIMSSGQQLSRSQRIMSQRTIKKLGDELIRLCDGIESHGLVDYQYGVWEDRIETVLEECLDLYDSVDAAAGASGGSR
ncbi:hypothetical protein Trco_005522 [Trichoderma cornu-damae]|uniref:Uncharacterized protein n=1 Tax=Trichoderma cornu-damae TaxID=654480 RepID=A0A9P8TWJ7_9HYPO|nr:hypothetical protein Trco_005522 [Trichoderma cornu-damae]